MTALTQLIHDLEAAEEGSRHLDCQIALAVGWLRWTPAQAKASGMGSRKHGGWYAPEDVRNGQPVMDQLHGTEIHRDPPRFSTSIDAKLPWENIELSRTDCLGDWVAVHQETVDSPPYQGRAATEPLARRVAALKAKEAEG